MSPALAPAQTAMLVADRLRGRAAAPWDVFGERIRRYEIHLNGREVEMVRGPIRLEGYGLRVFRPVEGGLGSGHAATNDISEQGTTESLKTAEATAALSRSPAKSVALPPKPSGALPSVESVDRALWERPEESLKSFVHGLLSALEGRKDLVPSFGSIRATLTDTTIANSEGGESRFSHTDVDFELALKAFGGSEGAAPGEYWVNLQSRRLETRHILGQLDTWCRRAEDVRHAKATPSGSQTVLFPTTVLADVLPAILGYRLGGAAQLRNMTPPAGTVIGVPSLSVRDDGLLPFGLGTSPTDDEGTPHRSRTLIEKGATQETMQDIVHASALGVTTTGNGRRGSVDFSNWFHFIRAPSPGPTTIVLEPGDGGTDEELIEGVEEGIWVDQLGYAFPDPISAAFGGELRVAYRIRHGKLAEAIRGGTVGGVLLGSPEDHPLLTSIGAMGSHPSLAGCLSSPTLRVDGFSVAGGN